MVLVTSQEEVMYGVTFDTKALFFVYKERIIEDLTG